MSLGINLLVELSKKAAEILEGFDIEIIEQHHNQKLDAPSGTALMIADGIKSVREDSEYVYDRTQVRPKSASMRYAAVQSLANTRCFLQEETKMLPFVTLPFPVKFSRTVLSRQRNSSRVSKRECIICRMFLLV